ncbi:hypothetical protein [Haloarchaeobius sp. DFWS5]|uniref:hypothetical protein n=1 Tax=Haloarchaeobius sp. DFWS5 TaxID=3446114 RepID=UPI003EBEC9BA
MTDDTVDVSDFITYDQQLPAMTPRSPIGPPQPTVETPRAPTSTVPEQFVGVEPTVDERTPFHKLPFWEDFMKRVRQNQDILILISDYHNDRGTGKTVLTIDLCDKMDRSEEGFIPSKASIQPENLIDGYTSHPRGSSLALDEAEAGIGAREAMTKINRMLSEIVSMARVEEKYVVLNMPASNHIDKNILDLAHYWILVQRRGLARVYQLKNNPFEQKMYPTPVQRLEWSDIENGHPVYDSLTQEKQQRLRNPGQNGEQGNFVAREDHEKILQKQATEIRREVRDDIIARALEHPKFADIPQWAIGDIADVSQTTVGNVKSDRGL